MISIFESLSTKWSHILGKCVSPDAKLAVFQGSPSHLWTAIEFFLFLLLFLYFLVVSPDPSHQLPHINSPSIA